MCVYIHVLCIHVLLYRNSTSFHLCLADTYMYICICWVLVFSVGIQVHLFEFHGVETVTVQAEASSRRCAILSVQNVTVSMSPLCQV